MYPALATTLKTRSCLTEYLSESLPPVRLSDLLPGVKIIFPSIPKTNLELNWWLYPALNPPAKLVEVISEAV